MSTAGARGASPFQDRHGCCDDRLRGLVEHLVVGTPAQNAAEMHRRDRGWRRHTGRTELPARPGGSGRSGRRWPTAGIRPHSPTAVAAGDPFGAQVVLAVVIPGAVTITAHADLAL